MKRLILLPLALLTFIGCQELKLNSCELELYVKGFDNEDSRMSIAKFRRHVDYYGWDLVVMPSKDYENRDKNNNSILINLDNTNSYHLDTEFRYSTKVSRDEMNYSQLMLQYQRKCNNEFTLNIPEVGKEIRKSFQMNQHVVFPKAANPTKEDIIDGLEGSCGRFDAQKFYHWASVNDIPKCTLK